MPLTVYHGTSGAALAPILGGGPELVRRNYTRRPCFCTTTSAAVARRFAVRKTGADDWLAGRVTGVVIEFALSGEPGRDHVPVRDPSCMQEEHEVAVFVASALVPVAVWRCDGGDWVRAAHGPVPVSPWRSVVWTDEGGREVKRLTCHTDELARVLDLPFPHGAVVREPVSEVTAITALMPWDFHGRNPFDVGFRFTDNVNQGDRPAVIVAKNEHTGDFLYEYEMPGGRTFLRNRAGRPISRSRVPVWAAGQL